jgi:hypothetical protein
MDSRCPEVETFQNSNLSPSVHKTLKSTDHDSYHSQLYPLHGNALELLALLGTRIVVDNTGGSRLPFVVRASQKYPGIPQYPQNLIDKETDTPSHRVATKKRVKTRRFSELDVFNYSLRRGVTAPDPSCLSPFRIPCSTSSLHGVFFLPRDAVSTDMYGGLSSYL